MLKSSKNRAMLLITPFLQFSLFHLFLLTSLSVLNSSSGQNISDRYLLRLKRQYNHVSDLHYPLDGVNEDDQMRSPLVLQATHNLTFANGPKGRCGICARTYRVLKEVKKKPNIECQRYFDSRQAALGDLTEFYHTLYGSRKQKETLTFMLSDSFPEFAFSASFMASNPNGPPFLMIEVAKSADQVLCVQSHQCPEPATTTTTTTTTVTTTSPISYLPPAESLLLTASHQAVDKLPTSDSMPHQPPNFWNVIMANSSPRIWVIATLVLTCVSFILLMILICTCIWICHTKRNYQRKRCRGTCRFGCTCPPDQIALDTASFRPIEPQTNGPMLTHPSVGRTWSLSNSTQVPINQLYVPLAANEKGLGTQSSETPPSQQMFAPGPLYFRDNWPQHQTPFQKSALTKDAMWRSLSDGSSLSDHTVPSAIGSGPAALRNQPSRSSGQPAAAYTLNANPSSATASTCMQSYVGAICSQGDSGATDGHPGSPMHFEDSQSTGRNGFNQNGLANQPAELRGPNGGLYDQNVGDMATRFAPPSEITNITPPAGFYDHNGKPTSAYKLDQSWTYGNHLHQSSFVPSTNPNSLIGAVKVLPNEILAGAKKVINIPPVDYKRHNGFLNGGEASLDDGPMRRPCAGLTSHILSHPLAEGVEQNYSYKDNSNHPLNSWTSSSAH